MKPIIFLTIIFSLLFNICAHAQHPDLQQGRWYVKHIIIGEDTVVIPSNPVDFPFAYLNFFSGSHLVASENTRNVNFYVPDCQIGFTGHANFISTDSFEFSDFSPFTINTECSTYLNDFMTSYVNFFIEHQTEVFTYSILSKLDGSLSLKIINNVGNKIEYANTFLVYPPAELTGNTWFLEKLVIGGVEYLPPQNEELSAIRYNFLVNANYEEIFNTIVCCPISGNQHFDIEQSQFYLYEIAIGLTQCGTPENNNYQTMYFDFFINCLPGPFHYSLITSGNDKTLTITNNIGDYGVYSNTITSVNTQESYNIKIFPNPTTDRFKIVVSGHLRIKQLKILNTTGQLILVETRDEINTSNLTKGVYFLQVETFDYKYITKRIVIE